MDLKKIKELILGANMGALVAFDEEFYVNNSYDCSKCPDSCAPGCAPSCSSCAQQGCSTRCQQGCSQKCATFLFNEIVKRY